MQHQIRGKELGSQKKVAISVVEVQDQLEQLTSHAE